MYFFCRDYLQQRDDTSIVNIYILSRNIAQMWRKYCTNVEKSYTNVETYCTNVSAKLQSKGESSFYRTPPSGAAAVGQVITGNIFHAEPEKYFFEPLHLTFKGNTRTLHNLLLNCFCCTKSKPRKEKPLYLQAFSMRRRNLGANRISWVSRTLIWGSGRFVGKIRVCHWNVNWGRSAHTYESLTMKTGSQGYRRAE